MNPFTNTCQQLNSNPEIEFSFYETCEGGRPTTQVWPRRACSTFRGLRDAMRDPQVYPVSSLRRKANGKYAKPDNLEAYSPATFRQRTAEEREAKLGAKDKSLVEGAGFVVFDLDVGRRNQPIGELARTALAEARLLSFAHTSFNHAPLTSEAWRVGLALSRLVSTAEYEHLWLHINQSLLASNANKATRNADRLYFFTAHPEGCEYRFYDIEGEPLDVDTVLATLGPISKQTYTTAANDSFLAANDNSDPFAEPPFEPEPLCGEPLALAEAWLEAHCQCARPSISGEHGHLALWQVAIKARNLQIPPVRSSLIIQRVFNPRCIPPWEPEDVDRKVRDAWSRGRTTPYACRQPHPAAAYLASRGLLSGNGGAK